jgi:hypothetical protein
VKSLDHEVQIIRRIRGEVDDVVISCDTFRLEQMDDDAWWAAVYRRERAVSFWITYRDGGIQVEVTNDELGCVDDTPDAPAGDGGQAIAPSGGRACQTPPASAAAAVVRPSRPPENRPARRWRQTPEAVEADLMRMWDESLGRRDADPVTLVNDIFDAVYDRLTGHCPPEASWSEPDNAGGR